MQKEREVNQDQSGLVEQKENGETIQEVGAYVGKLEKRETRAINASISMDISEIYDVTFERK